MNWTIPIPALIIFLVMLGATLMNVVRGLASAKKATVGHWLQIMERLYAIVR